jgi:hypothetical protein
MACAGNPSPRNSALRSLETGRVQGKVKRGGAEGGGSRYSFLFIFLFIFIRQAWAGENENDL